MLIDKKFENLDFSWGSYIYNYFAITLGKWKSTRHNIVIHIFKLKYYLH